MEHTLDRQHETGHRLDERWAPRFFAIWTGQAFSLFGSHIVQFALVWWLTERTGSATVLATASLFGMLPQILLSPFAGALVDRWNRRIVMMVADSAIAALTLGLAFLFYTGHVQVWHIYVIMLLRSAGGAFHWPAMQASTSLMVPKEHLTRVGGLNQTLSGLIGIAAPPLGAMLLQVVPVWGVLLVDVCTAFLAVPPLFFVRIPQPKRRCDGEGTNAKTTLWTDLVDGFRYIAAWRGMLILGVLAALLNCLFTPAFSLLPLLVAKHFGGSAVQLGVINSAWGIGMLAGGLVLSAWGGFKKKMATSLMGVIGMGLGFVVVAVAPSNFFWLALTGTVLSGFMAPMANGPLFAVVQSVVDPDMQGRVMSLMNSTASAMSPLGLLIGGKVTDLLGLQVWYYVAGIAAMIMGIGGFFVEPVMTLESNHH